ncbi:hypothetical protein JHK82_036422 [Glycine max]|nr:hypothetical protein JHK85_037149 [Glycine max]KAG5113153.1 hypothetical protein JHK82_036422 [Glycine max]
MRAGRSWFQNPNIGLTNRQKTGDLDMLDLLRAMFGFQVYLCLLCLVSLNYDDLNEYFWSSDCFSLGWPIRNDGEFFKSTSDLAQGRKGAAARKSGNQILLRHEHSGTSSAALTVCGHFLYWVCRYLGPDPELSRLSSMEIH